LWASGSYLNARRPLDHTSGSCGAMRRILFCALASPWLHRSSPSPHGDCSRPPIWCDRF
jgi:hypothetical protein